VPQAGLSARRFIGMAFEPSARTRRRALSRAAALLEPGVIVREIGFGRAQGRWTTPAIVAISVFGAAFAVALLLGAVLFPGVLLLGIVGHYSWPPRVVVIADLGVALISRSGVTGRPHEVIARLPHYALAVPASADGRRRALGPDIVKFSDKEIRRLVAALPQPAPSFAS
jgi:hypothetical protein